jgi:peptidoglycan hydrolase CwlO-like protein
VPAQPRPVEPRAPRATRRFALLVGGLVLASCLLAAPASAGKLESARARLASLERQIKGEEVAITRQHGRLDALSVDLARVQGALQDTQAQLASTQQRLADAEARYEALRERLQGVTRTAYEQGPLAPVEALLGATSLNDLLDRYQYLDSVQLANAEVANGLANQAARLKAGKRELDALVSRQTGQSVQLQSHQAALRDGLLQQQRQLAQLNSQRRKAAQLVQQLSLPLDPGYTGAGEAFGDWAALLLSRLGAPGCQQNLTVVVSWQVAEGTAAAYNPLATTHYMPGSTAFNSAGVRNFPSLEVGLQATMDTLRQGAASYGYGAILYDLEHCAPATTTAMAINASSWCRGCAGGLYVLNVLPLVEADYGRFANE